PARLESPQEPTPAHHLSRRAASPERQPGYRLFARAVVLCGSTPEPALTCPVWHGPRATPLHCRPVRLVLLALSAPGQSTSVPGPRRPVTMPQPLAGHARAVHSYSGYALAAPQAGVLPWNMRPPLNWTGALETP